MFTSKGTRSVPVGRFEDWKLKLAMTIIRECCELDPIVVNRNLYRQVRPFYVRRMSTLCDGGEFVQEGSEVGM